MKCIILIGMYSLETIFFIGVKLGISIFLYVVLIDRLVLRKKYIKTSAIKVL